MKEKKERREKEKGRNKRPRIQKELPPTPKNPKNPKPSQASQIKQTTKPQAIPTNYIKSKHHLKQKQRYKALCMYNVWGMGGYS